MDRAFSNLLTWLTRPMAGVWNRQHEALDIDTAMIIASTLCSATPARILASAAPPPTDSFRNRTGIIQAGEPADLLLADVVEDREGYRLLIDRVFLAGVEHGVKDAC